MEGAEEGGRSVGEDEQGGGVIIRGVREHKNVGEVDCRGDDGVAK